jgi:predicted dehydrogenase
VRGIETTQGRIELVAAVDLDATRVREFCARHHIARAFTDYAAMLREMKPDLVLVAAPPGVHADLSIAAMEAGAWVLCEKPLCGSLAELDRIAAGEQRTGLYTASVFQMRFASSTAHLRRLADTGLLGRSLIALCNTLWYRDAAYYTVPWRGKWATELGGTTMGQGIHAMDLLLHLLGDWAEIRAQAATLDRTFEVEDVSMAMVRFVNGAQAAIVNSVLSPRQESYLRLDYQNATVELTHLYSFMQENWKFTPAAHKKEDAALLQAWQNFPPDVGSTHGAQLNALVADMDAGRRPLTSGDEARRTLELLTALYKASATGQPVRRGSICPGDPFYAAIHGGMKIWRHPALA